MKIGTVPGAGTAIRSCGGYAFGLSGVQSALLASFGYMLTAIISHPKGQSAHFSGTICFECLSPRVAAA